MKVVCIRTENIKGNVLEYMKMYHVIKEGLYGNDEVYYLAEFGDDQPFRRDRFIPISEIDETTFERNYKKELV